MPSVRGATQEFMIAVGPLNSRGAARPRVGNRYGLVHAVIESGIAA